MGLIHRGKGRFTLGLEKAIQGLGTTGRRQINSQALLTEYLADLCINNFKVDIFCIDAVDDHHPALFLLPRPVHHAPAAALTPCWALMITATVSTAGRTLSAAPTKSGNRGYPED